MKPFTAPNRPFCVEPFAPLTHQPRSVIDAGLVYWGSHESEPQKAQKHQTQQLGCVSCLRVGILEVGLLGFGHSLITGRQRAAVLEDEVDETYYIHTYRQTNKQTHTYRQTHRQTNRHKQKDRQTDRQTHRQKGRPANININKRTNTHAHIRRNQTEKQHNTQKLWKQYYHNDVKSKCPINQRDVAPRSCTNF